MTTSAGRYCQACNRGCACGPVLQITNNNAWNGESRTTYERPPEVRMAENRQARRAREAKERRRGR